MGKIVLLTGGSSGIGRAAADWLQSRGCTVYELSRRGEDRPGVHHLSGDVTDADSVRAAVAAVMAAEGRIDVLVNNAGFGISGAAEFTDLSQAQRQLDVNFWGMVRATQAVLPIMRRQRSGRIVNTSSVAGAVPIPFQSFYSVSKAAINSYTMSVQNEVRPWGIRLCAVMPGDTRTGFTDARARSFAGDEEYEGRIARSVAKMEKDERNGASAESIGALIGRAALSESGRIFYTPGVYQLVILLMRLLPSAAANRILSRMYAS